MRQLLDARYQIVQVLNVEKSRQSYLVKLAESDEKLHILISLSPKDYKPDALKITRNLFTSSAAKLKQIALEHDKIQKLFDYFEEDEVFYLVQEFISGHSLLSEISLKKNLTEYQVINILLEILDILVEVHHRGLIHRNIKPGNIIRRESDSKLVLTDFASVEEAVTNFAGSPGYIATEQAYGNTQPNSDIYSLGISAIVALTGLPASKISSPSSPKNFFTGEIRWRQRGQKVNVKLARIINKMVREDYRHRYQSAAAVLEDLNKLQQTYLNPQPRSPIKIKHIAIAGIASFILVGAVTWFSSKPANLDYAKEIYNRGVVNYEQGHYQAAIANFTQAIEANPSYAAAYNQRGDAYYRLGDYEKSQQDSSSAIRLNPQDSNAYYDRGFALFQLGNYNGAIADYKQAIKINPENAYAYYGRGLALAKIKDKHQALDDLSQAIALSPDYVPAYIERAQIHRQLGNQLEAFKDLDSAISLDPESAEAYYQRGQTNFLMNQNSAALQDFTRAIELDPKYIAPYLGRGDVHAYLGYLDKALTDYNKAIELDPKSSLAYNQRGLHRFKQKDIQGALEDYNKAIAIAPNHAEAYNNRGTANLELGNLNNAMDDYSKAIEINQDYAAAYYNRGMLRVDLAKVPEAIEDFQRAMDIYLEKGDRNTYSEVKSKLRSLNPGEL